MMLSSSSFLVVFPFSILVIHVADASGGGAMTPYFKEILMGRCYERPPSANLSPDMCPSIVGSIMGAIEGRLDGDIGLSTFDSYIEMADLSTDPNQGIFWIVEASPSSSICSATLDAWTKVLGKTSVDKTLGGALFRDLVFCGVDLKAHCPGVALSPSSSSGDIDVSDTTRGAQASLWAALYQGYAKVLSGRLTIIVDKRVSSSSWCGGSDDRTALETLLSSSWLEHNVIPFLNSEAISSVDIYLVQEDGFPAATTSACSSLQTSFRNSGIPKVNCIVDSDELFLLFCRASKDSLALCPSQIEEGSKNGKEEAGNGTMQSPPTTNCSSTVTAQLQQKVRTSSSAYTILSLVSLVGLVLLGLFWWNQKREELRSIVWSSQPPHNEETIPFAIAIPQQDT